MPPRRRRIWRWLLALPLALLLVLGGASWWTTWNGSLRQALRIAQSLLPADQQLQFEAVQGSIAGGGSIGRLYWEKPGTGLTIHDLQLDWSLHELFGRELVVRTLQASAIHVRLTPTSEPDEPSAMPADLSLPLDLTVPLAVGRIEVENVDEAGSADRLRFDDLRARYDYDGTQHTLQLDSLRQAQSSVQVRVQLHARELQLQARLDATLQGLAPQVAGAMRVALDADGSLAGEDAATIRIRFEATPQPQDQAAAGADGTPSLRAAATVHPWREQPLQQLTLTADGLDARAFHAAAPVTGLRGTANLRPVEPDAPVWDAQVDLVNEVPGAWDAGRLPLRTLALHGRLTLEQFDIESALATLAGARDAGAVTLAGAVNLQQPSRTTLRLGLQHIDLAPLLATLPRTDISGEAVIEPLPGEGNAAALAEASWQARAALRNDAPGPLDRQQLPIGRVLAQLEVTPQVWNARTLQVETGSGRIQMRGSFEPAAQRLDVSGELRRVPLRQIHGKLAAGLASELSGTLQASGAIGRDVDFNVDITSDVVTQGPVDARRGPWEIRALQARGRWSPARLVVERIHLDAFRARVDGRDIDVALPGLDAFSAQLAAAAPGLGLEADAAMRTQSGAGRVAMQVTSAAETLAWLKGLPLVGERLPGGLAARGSARFDAQWQGGWRQWADAFARPGSQPALRLDAGLDAQDLHVEWHAAGDGEAATIEVATSFDIDMIEARVEGNPAAARLRVAGDARANDARAVLDVDLGLTQGALRDGARQWNLAVDRFDVAANLPGQTDPWQLQIDDGLEVAAEFGDAIALRAGAGRARILPPAAVIPDARPLEVSWQPLSWRRAAGGATTLDSSGEVRGIQPAWLDPLLARAGEGPLAGAGMGTDLVVNGAWRVRMSQTLDVEARFEREGGDIWLMEPSLSTPRRAQQPARSDRDIALGVRTLALQLRSAGEQITTSFDWDSARAGSIAARLQTRLVRAGDGWSLPRGAPLSGTVQARLPDLGMWGVLAPPGWRVQGALDADITLAGSVAAPQLRGPVNASGLGLRSVLDGVDLHDGLLRATLEGTRLSIAELMLQGGTGSRAYVRGLSGNRTQPPTERGRMTARGMIDWSGVAEAAPGQSGIEMDLRAELQRMQVLVRSDRQVTLSGELSAALDDGAVRVRGDIQVDRAAIMLPEAGAPTIGDDVRVIRSGDVRDAGAMPAGELRTARPMDLQIDLDLGRDLALQGYGITTRLEGELSVRSAGGADAVSVVGEVRTVEGRYRAWGQALNVETGEVRFNGPYGNPSLNLLAIRPEIAVRAGVRVTGTLLAPRAQLYSDPDMPEAEKLSWVVLGRAAATSGAEGASMQQAALGLLAGGVGGSLAGGLGLDELGLGESSVSIGKRLSDQLYVTYQAGFSGAASTFFVFYDITRRLTARAQTGEASAVDLIYTISFD